MSGLCAQSTIPVNRYSFNAGIHKTYTLVGLLFKTSKTFILKIKIKSRYTYNKFLIHNVMFAAC